MPRGNDEKIVTSVSIDGINKEYLDTEVDNKSALVNRLLTAHRLGGDSADRAVARMREQQLESERRRIEAQLETVTDELERVKKITEHQREKTDELLEEADDVLDPETRSPDNPAVQNWAEKVGMTPNELISELEDRSEK